MKQGEAVAIGEFRCFPLSDGSLIYPKDAMFPDRSEAELADGLAPETVPSEMNVGYSGLLIDTGTRRILIDTGAGPLGPNTGHLHEGVSACGISPEQIDQIILSHMHPDHIGGLTAAGGDLRYPNAEVMVSRREYDFWMSPENQSKLESKTLLKLGELEPIMLSWIRSNVTPLASAGRLCFVEGGDELTTGIQVLPAFGHTPGHVAILISSGRQQLLFAGDAIFQPAHVKYPDWKSVFDVLPDQAIATRRQILDRSASDRCLTFHFHFPYPCLGTVARSNSGYRWEPVAL
jgi:glyoxylase-like metal-dependent hydrolase (beta-lactamase superfamily II)